MNYSPEKINQQKKESPRVNLETLGKLVEPLSLADSVLARANPNSNTFNEFASLASAINS